MHHYFPIDHLLINLDQALRIAVGKPSVTERVNHMDHTTTALNQKTLMLIRRHPATVKTITADNGTKFHQYKKIEGKSCAMFYFANPYHSWERGSNENCNGLIRHIYPKGHPWSHSLSHSAMPLPTN